MFLTLRTSIVPPRCLEPSRPCLVQRHRLLASRALGVVRVRPPLASFPSPTDPGSTLGLPQSGRGSQAEPVNDRQISRVGQALPIVRELPEVRATALRPCRRYQELRYFRVSEIALEMIALGSNVPIIPIVPALLIARIDLETATARQSTRATASLEAMSM